MGHNIRFSCLASLVLFVSGEQHDWDSLSKNSSNICYYSDHQNRTWYDAHTFCENNGMILPVFDTTWEYSDFLAMQQNTNENTMSLKEAWIGYRRDTIHNDSKEIVTDARGRLAEKFDWINFEWNPKALCYRSCNGEKKKLKNAFCENPCSQAYPTVCQTRDRTCKCPLPTPYKPPWTNLSLVNVKSTSPSALECPSSQKSADDATKSKCARQIFNVNCWNHASTVLVLSIVLLLSLLGMAAIETYIERK